MKQSTIFKEAVTMAAKDMKGVKLVNYYQDENGNYKAVEPNTFIEFLDEPKDHQATGRWKVEQKIINGHIIKNPQLSRSGWGANPYEWYKCENNNCWLNISPSNSLKPFKQESCRG